MDEEDRSLDIVVAQALGWRWNAESAWSPGGSRYARMRHRADDPWYWLPYFSRDIGSAFYVVEFLARAPHYAAVTVSTLGVPHARITQNAGGIGMREIEALVELNAVPDTRPLTERCARAICQAFLRWLHKEQES